MVFEWFEVNNAIFFFKAHLPGGLGHDPRLWQREDVAIFMRYCEREFDLDKIDMDKFQMNGESRDFFENRDGYIAF